jgi:hypothetical protein
VKRQKEYMQPGDNWKKEAFFILNDAPNHWWLGFKNAKGDTFEHRITLESYTALKKENLEFKRLKKPAYLKKKNADWSVTATFRDNGR